MVNGNPAISYYDYTNADLKYVRASDASGESWGTPRALGSAGWAGRYTSLAVVNGNPAISYLGDYYPTYVRAMDATGSSWETPQDVGSVVAGTYACLVVVNGNPAISYWDWTNRDLKFAIYY